MSPSAANTAKLPCAVIPNPAFVVAVIITSILLSDIIIPRASPDANLLEDGVTVTEYYAAATVMHVIIMATVLMLYHPPASRRSKMDRITIDRDQDRDRERQRDGRDSRSPRVTGMACVADTQHMQGKSAIDPVTATIIAYTILKVIIFFMVNISNPSKPQTRQIVRITAAIAELIVMFAFVSNMRENARTDAVKSGVIANNTANSNATKRSRHRRWSNDNYD